METIKRIGRYTVPFEVFPDVVAELKLVVAPEGEELPPAEELAALEAQEAAEAAAAAAAAKAAETEYLPELGGRRSPRPRPPRRRRRPADAGRRLRPADEAEPAV